VLGTDRDYSRRGDGFSSSMRESEGRMGKFRDSSDDRGEGREKGREKERKGGRMWSISTSFSPPVDVLARREKDIVRPFGRWGKKKRGEGVRENFLLTFTTIGCKGKKKGEGLKSLCFARSTGEERGTEEEEHGTVVGLYFLQSVYGLAQSCPAFGRGGRKGSVRSPAMGRGSRRKEGQKKGKRKKEELGELAFILFCS